MGQRRTHQDRPKGHRLRASQVHEDTRTSRERDRGAKERAALDQEMDDLLEEIDGVLEQNAEEFVKGYVQKGGE